MKDSMTALVTRRQEPLQHRYAEVPEEARIADHARAAIGRQDEIAVLRHPPPGRQLVGPETIPRRDHVDRCTRPKGLRDNPRLHLIRPASLTGRMDLQRSDNPA